jgi:hypothetical protein
MRDVSMWCPNCEVWTKDYNPDGSHNVCGNDVTSSSFASGFPELNYEGPSVLEGGYE